MNKFDKLENKVPMPKGGKVSDGYPTGGKVIPTPKAGENPKVTVKGTGKAKKQTATWY
jgi:hypothetical protein